MTQVNVISLEILESATCCSCQKKGNRVLSCIIGSVLQWWQLALRTIKQWNNLFPTVVDVPSVEVLRKGLKNHLSKMVWIFLSWVVTRGSPISLPTLWFYYHSESNAQWRHSVIFCIFSLFILLLILESEHLFDFWSNNLAGIWQTRPSFLVASFLSSKER